MRAWISAPVVVLFAVALLAATGACLVHPDDGAPDLCLSLLAVTVGVMLARSLHGDERIVLDRRDRYRPFARDPAVPPPRA